MIWYLIPIPVTIIAFIAWSIIYGFEYKTLWVCFCLLIVLFMFLPLIGTAITHDAGFERTTTLDSEVKIRAFKTREEKITTESGWMFLTIGSYKTKQEESVFYKYYQHTEYGYEQKTLETDKKVYISEIEDKEPCLQKYNIDVLIPNDKKFWYISLFPAEVFYVFNVPSDSIQNEFDISL